MDEIRRQMVHIAGLLFIVLAQFTSKWIAASYFLLIAATFFIYSEHIRREKKRLHGILQCFEGRFRDVVMTLERADAPRPFHGAFWFFMGCGVTFVLFPLNIASAACAALAAGDGMSTIAGTRWGRHKLVGRKSWEGSLAMFAFSLGFAALFVGPVIALIGAVAATIIEILPETKILQKHKRLGFIDDNLLVPLVSGAVMLAAAFVFSL